MWRKLSGEKISGEILIEVENLIRKETQNGHKLKVCIGTDSQEHKNWIDFASVIVFVRERSGGFMLIKNTKTTDKMSIKERMITEVAKSIEIAYKLCDMLDQHGVELEVHADINTDARFKSNTALSEAMGYIKSMGYVFKAKPDAFASSSCADRFVN
ncbi:MAG: ribonuclease H-like YkuK family protein [Bacteroidia bacterium]